MFVTLEPCNHTGRTPPCVPAIIAAGISRTVIGAIDPDPRVDGGGTDALRAEGIEVDVGVGSGEEVDPGYFHHRRTGRPLITLKMAATLDGQTAALDGSSQWITSEEARADSHRLRAEADAVVVGAGTLRADDPLLDVRLPGYVGHQPQPVIVAGNQPLPTSARLWERNPIVLDGLSDLPAGIKSLANRGLLALLVEGGPKLAASLVEARLADRGILYLGGVLAGGTGRPLFDRPWPSLDAAKHVAIEKVTRLGPDLRIDFTFR
jgi:diaminohydroxyphosphoribosylaminopyrimidine deaminase/5-amino-6-(5-phosphoribosylamino)uracil reductase